MRKCRLYIILLISAFAVLILDTPDLNAEVITSCKSVGFVYDVEAARQGGHTDTTIANHLAQVSQFDVARARQAGFSDSQIINYLNGRFYGETNTVPQSSEGSFLNRQVNKLKNHLNPDSFWEKEFERCNTGMLDSNPSFLDLDIYITGKISQSDVQAFKSLSDYLNLYKGKRERFIPIQIFLNSSGGDLYAALDIGRIIFDQGLYVWMGRDAHCYSSCFLIYAGGIKRVNPTFSPVAVHRPYRSDLNAEGLDLKSFELAYSQALKDIEDYLNALGVGHEIIDYFKTVPSAEMKILTSEELERNGAGVNNIAAGEISRHKISAQCGEDYYIKREKTNKLSRQLGEKNCGHIDFDNDFEAVSACVLEARREAWQITGLDREECKPKW